MTPEKQRIAIAEACGWVEESKSRWRSPCGRIFEDWTGGLACPNYLNDLNAMNEALGSLDAFMQVNYVKQLSSVLDLGLYEAWLDWEVFAFSQATAAQCAESFLKTLNLWKDKEA